MSMQKKDFENNDCQTETEYDHLVRKFKRVIYRDDNSNCENRKLRLTEQNGAKKIEPMVQWSGYDFDFNEPLHLGVGMVFSFGAPNRTDYPLK